MHVVCPNCGTTFSVPPEAYRPGRKARCSQCHFVFPLVPEELGGQSVQPGPLPPAKQRLLERIRRRLGLLRSYRKVCLLGAAVFLCCIGLFFGGYTLYSSYKVGKSLEMMEKRREAREKEAELRKEQDQAVNSISLVGVRQTVVKNKNLGPLIVIEGFARNDFDSPRDYIVVEARLLDESGKVLGSAQQACGISLTLTQLEVLTGDELKKALTNMVDIYSKNYDVQPGEKVPFVIVLAGVPKSLYSYEVRPLSAQIPQPHEGP